MASLIMQQRGITVTALIVIVLFGVLFRLHNLEKRTISHPEIYVPGIELPQDLSIPPPRLTLFHALTRIGSEPHPPAYYVMMLGWTKLFGTNILALRLPSVLFGVASIVLIYVLCTLKEDKLTGLLAAAMLAFNGFHIFWSQIARMYSMACFLGVLSTTFLILLSKGGTRQRVFQFLYLGTTLTGLATVIYFWPIFATHMIWTLAGNWRKKTSAPGLLRLQILIFILGSPLIALAAYQSHRSSYIAGNLFAHLGQFLQLGFLFAPDPWVAVPNFMPAVATISLVIVALFLLVLGLLTKKNQEQENARIAGPTPVFMVLTGILMFLIILLFAKLAHARDPSRTPLIVASSTIPLLLPLIDFLLRRYWSHLQNLGILINERVSLLSHLSSLNALLAILPVAMIAGVSQFISLFAPRGILLYLPYFIIVLCTGLVSLVRRHILWVILVLILTVIHTFSVVHWHHRLHSAIDYKALAEKWTPKIKNSDLIFVHRHWATTPIFYYLKADQYHYVGSGYSTKIQENPNSRVWILSFEGIPILREMKEALSGYVPVASKDALRIRAELYVRQENR